MSSLKLQRIDQTTLAVNADELSEEELAAKIRELSSAGSDVG